MSKIICDHEWKINTRINAPRVEESNDYEGMKMQCGVRHVHYRSSISNFHARPNSIISGAFARECEHVTHARVHACSHARCAAIVSVFSAIIAKLRSPARGRTNRTRNAKARKCVSLCPATLHVITAYGMYGENTCRERTRSPYTVHPRCSADAQSVWNDNKWSGARGGNAVIALRARHRRIMRRIKGLFAATRL